MAVDNGVDIAAIFREGHLVDKALNAAARDAVMEHRRLGLPMVVWRDGKPVWIDAREIDLGPDDGQAGGLGHPGTDAPGSRG